METVKVLVVGSGVAGANKHVPLFQKCPEVTVVGVCDPDLARAKRVAAERGLPGAYASLREGLRATGAGIVSICTPPQTHKELAIYAMQHGADVLLEKPFTITLAEARRVIAVQKRTGRKLSVVHQNKFTWGVMQMEEIVRRGEAGRVLHLGLTWLTNGDSDRMVIDPNFWCHKIPGGRWAESLPHQLYIAYALVGEMRLLSVAARKTTAKWPWMAADEVDVVLESREGYVNIRMSANPEEPKRRINILHGTKASFMFSYKVAIPLAERPHARSAGELIRRGLAARLPGRTRVPAPPTPHEEVIRRFVAHVLHDAPPPTSPEEALHVEELTEGFGRQYERIVRRMAGGRGSRGRSR
jgi:predicted dehydrogenase